MPVKIQKSGFDQYFIITYRNNYERVVRYLENMTGDFSLAEDLAHELFTRFYKNRIFVEGDERKTRNYMIKSARNIAIDHQRKQRRINENFRLSVPLIEDTGEAFNTELENMVIEGEIISTVHETLLEFPERSRRVFLDIVLEGKNIKLMSSEQKISRYYIKKTYREICSRLYEKLKVYRE